MLKNWLVLRDAHHRGAAVAYAVTGDWLAALTLSLLEPTVQAVVYFFHERIWQHKQTQQQSLIQAASL